MCNKKLKVGDRVRIINASCIEPYELNEVGTIVDIDVYDSGWTSYVVDMGRPRRPDKEEGDETRWWLQEKYIELAIKPNQQLLFEFMNEVT